MRRNLTHTEEKETNRLGGGKKDSFSAQGRSDDEIDDSGGECVSGEGIWSVPSVRDIQEALVRCGDKPKQFACSKEWIGCFEACLVLDHLYSVSYILLLYCVKNLPS